MRRIIIYSKYEMELIEAVRDYLIDKLSSIDGAVVGGVHVRPKPAKVRLDVIEINCFGGEREVPNSKIGGFVNVNYQHDDLDKVEEYTLYIDDLLSDAVIAGRLFESDRQQMGRISPYLWMGNNMYKLTNI